MFLSSGPSLLITICFLEFSEKYLVSIILDLGLGGLLLLFASDVLLNSFENFVLMGGILGWFENFIVFFFEVCFCSGRFLLDLLFLRYL